MGPYLSLRDRRITSTSGQGGILESKLPAFGMMGFALYLCYYLVSQLSLTSTGTADFLALFQTQRLVHVSTIDFVILSLALWDPIGTNAICSSFAIPDL